MQLVDTNIDSRLYIANMPTDQIAGRRPAGGHRATAGNDGGLIWRLKATNASERLLALMMTGVLVATSPALLSTVRSVVSLALQILLEAGHAGLIAFQIFGR